MDKDEMAIDEMVKGVMIGINSAIKNAPITSMTTALVVSSGTDDGYKIKINSEEYDNILTLNGISLNVNNTVVVVYPNGQMNNMFILGRIM